MFCEQNLDAFIISMFKIFLFSLKFFYIFVLYLDLCSILIHKMEAIIHDLIIIEEIIFMLWNNLNDFILLPFIKSIHTIGFLVR